MNWFKKKLVWLVNYFDLNSEVKKDAKSQLEAVKAWAKQLGQDTPFQNSISWTSTIGEVEAVVVKRVKETGSLELEKLVSFVVRGSR